MSKKLNLGCGRFPLAGYVNVDIDPTGKPEVIHNLDVLPYPFADNTFEEIRLDHCLEHLSDVFAVMTELARVLHPGGRIIVRVPHFSRGFTHSGHRRGFDVAFPLYFNPKFGPGYIGTTLVLKRMRLRWSAQPYVKRQLFPAPLVWAMTAVGAVIDLFANLCPSCCSRIWCFWVGGFEEIEFVFTKE